MVQAVFHLAGRQTEGFLESVFELLGAELSVPDHTTLSRRRGRLRVTLPLRELHKARHVVVNSTGVKVYGEGEWKVRQHGWSKRRTRRKLHVSVDEETREMVSACAKSKHTRLVQLHLWKRNPRHGGTCHHRGAQLCVPTSGEGKSVPICCGLI